MANYCATARSNYFAVKDQEEFKKWAESHRLQILEGGGKNTGLFGITPGDNSDSGAWPNMVWNESAGEEVEFDILNEVGAHLPDGHVAILMEVGNEMLSYVHGWAGAINSKGEVVEVCLGDIYKKAMDLGGHITEVLH